MERGKERAELRAAEMKRLAVELENKRDRLLDEVAHKQGESAAIEATLKRIHEMILDINKDEQTHLGMGLIDQKKQEIVEERKKQKKIHKQENEPRKKKVEKALDGIKNHGRTKEIQERARKARVKKTTRGDK
jgi:hypothetical protein